ncbi:Pkinase-domain-containing protein, partial [Martensiomyces pterosporus]
MADIYTAATGAPNPDSLHPSHRQQPKIVTVPCKYRAGRVLGHGTYAVVKEMIHIDTGVHYAGKVINKKHMRGREQAIPNEINILKRLSRKHPNVLTLYDYFETPHNVYLITELCTGGELFERICKETAFTEQDASRIIRQIVEGVSFLHQNSVVHRDLKTENCLFRTSERESEVAIADFGLSKIINEGSNYALMTHCGTPGYMAPEVVQRLGHGKPVDMWAVGVIAYFILSGTTPFEREDPKAEAVAVVKCDYSFEPLEHWCHISPAAQHFIASLLVYDPAKRITAKQALAHPWLQGMKRMVMPPVS